MIDREFLFVGMRWHFQVICPTPLTAIHRSHPPHSPTRALATLCFIMLRLLTSAWVLFRTIKCIGAVASRHAWSSQEGGV